MNSGISDSSIGSELVDDDPTFADIVTEFVSGLGQRLKGMEDAIRTADFERLAVAAHQLKGSGGGYGYPILTEQAGVLERHARTHAMDSCVQSLQDLKALCGRIVVQP